MENFTREELCELRQKASLNASIEGLNEGRKRAYERLADSADMIDAMIARSTERVDMTEVS